MSSLGASSPPRQSILSLSHAAFLPIMGSSHIPPTTSSAPLQSTHYSILFFFFSTPVSTGLEGDLTVMVVICFFLSLLLPSISPLAHEEHHTYPCVSNQPGPPDQIEGLTSQLTRAPQPNLGTPRHVALLPHHGATHLCSIGTLSRVQQSRAGVGGPPPDAVPYSVGLWQCAYQSGAAKLAWYVLACMAIGGHVGSIQLLVSGPGRCQCVQYSAPHGLELWHALRLYWELVDMYAAKCAVQISPGVFQQV